MFALQGAIKQLYAIKIGCPGYALNFRSHGLKFGINHQSLSGIISSRCRLLRKLLHAD